VRTARKYTGCILQSKGNQRLINPSVLQVWRPRHDTAKETKAPRPKSKSTQIDGGWKDTECLDSQLLRVCCLLDRGWVEGARGMIRAPERRDIVKHRRYAVAGASAQPQPSHQKHGKDKSQTGRHQTGHRQGEVEVCFHVYMLISKILGPKYP
jgi:hypothetical protein